MFVLKKSGELWMCIDYRELNKKTRKDSYPLPLPDEVQDQLSGSTIFSALDLQSGYWQLPVNPEDYEKTAFCPGPGMDLFEFCRMPFGLCGAPSSFQRLMNSVLRGLPFVAIYLDDILIHSSNVELHRKHLTEVFQCLQAAGLTLRGKKCHLGMSKVSYLGHEFSASGMSPSQKKIEAIINWPIPTNVTQLCQFLGPANYYRRYIQHFADISAPLNALTQKCVQFQWTNECADAFTTLKSHLTKAPILAYPQFSHTSTDFTLFTNASAVGLGAILEQNGRIIAYASRTLTSSEQQYSVIQRECLAIVHACKQFHHYLLGRHFVLITDHAPLQWPSAQKMQGMLCCWALAMQEYDFTIKYHRGSLNGNADALSRYTVPVVEPCAAVLATLNQSPDIIAAQKADSVISQLFRACLQSDSPPKKATNGVSNLYSDIISYGIN